MEQEKSRLQRIEEQLEGINKEKEKSKKKFKLPRKGKVSKRKAKDGYATVVVMNENGTVDFKRERIEGNTIRLEDTWHAISAEDMFYYKGKPIIFQPKHRKNPYNPFSLQNETYGQKHIMARMLNDVIRTKKSFGGNIIWWLIGAIVVGYLIFQGGFF